MKGESLDEIPFRRTEGGWIFALRDPLLFRPPGYFLVNSAQKAAIAARLRSNRAIRLGLITPLILLAAPVSAALPVPKVPAWGGVLFALLGVYSLFALVDVFERRRLRPLLAGLPRTSGKITLCSQLRGTARNISFPLLFLFFSAFASTLILSAAVLGRRSLLDHGSGLLLCGMGAVFWGALIAAKQFMNGKE